MHLKSSGATAAIRPGMLVSGPGGLQVKRQGFTNVATNLGTLSGKNTGSFTTQSVLLADLCCDNTRHKELLHGAFSHWFMRCCTSLQVEEVLPS
jgi:hypothetical protein